MNFPKFLTIVLAVALGFASQGYAQGMEMHSSSDDAVSEMRAALDIMGHDMGKHYEHIKKAHELDPTMPMANIFMAVNASDQEQAKAFIEKFLAYTGELSAGEKVFAKMAAHFDDSTYKASSDAAELLELYPSDAGLHVLLGFIFMGDEKVDEAIAALDKAIATSGHPGAYNMKAYALMRKGDMDSAKEALMAYADKVPNHPNPHDSMGDLYMANKDYKNAYEEFTKASQMEGAHPSSEKKAEQAKSMMKP